MNVLITTPFGRFYVPGIDEAHAGDVLTALANTIVLDEGPEYGALNSDPIGSRLSILGSIEIRPPLEIDKPLSKLMSQLIAAMIEQKRGEADQIQRVAGAYSRHPKGDH